MLAAAGNARRNNSRMRSVSASRGSTYRDDAMAMSNSVQRGLLWGFIVSICVCGMFGIFVLLTASFGWWQLRVLMTTATVSAASILAMAAAIAWEARRWRWIGLAGMLVPGPALVGCLLMIWDLMPMGYMETIADTVAILCTLSVALPHLGLLSLARLHRGFEWVRIGTALAIGALTLVICGMILDWGSDLSLRIMASLAILSACGTIAVFVLHRVSRIRSDESIVTTTREIELTCPRCGKAQRLPTGLSKCACGLRVRIEIEEEACRKCGYSLYNISSANCPECGTAVSQG